MLKPTSVKDALQSPSAQDAFLVQGWVRTRRDAKGFSFIEVNDGSCLKNLQAIAPATLANYAEIQRLTQREQRRAELTKVAFIQIGVAYPGVIIRIADQRFVTDREIHGSRFSLDRETRALRLDKVSK